MNQIHRRWRTGFTLVELLVVIGIIAVLLGILLPSLGKARKQAQAMRCNANLKQLAMAFHMYANDYKGVLPYTTTTLSAAQAELWINAVDPYLRAKSNNANRSGVAGNREYTAYKQCPQVNDEWNLTLSGGLGSGQTTGGQNTTNEYSRSYKMNSFLRHAVQTGPTTFTLMQAKISQVKQSAKFVMLGDGVSMDQTGSYANQYDNGQFSMDPNYLLFGGSGTPAATPPVIRHDGACNIVFVDGHAETLKFPTMERTLGEPYPKIKTWQTEYVTAAGAPVYLDTSATATYSTKKTIEQMGIHRNPNMPIIWSDLPNLTR